MRKILLQLGLLGLLGGGACDEKDSPNDATGTIIGTYSNGFISKLVIVDEKYPIGKDIEYIGNKGNCTDMPSDGTYKNIIQVQALGLKTGDKISFSYRAFDSTNEEDSKLFDITLGNAVCGPPAVPIYVITDYKFLK
jgi:hypothetical protein